MGSGPAGVKLERRRAMNPPPERSSGSDTGANAGPSTRAAHSSNDMGSSCTRWTLAPTLFCLMKRRPPRMVRSPVQLPDQVKGDRRFFRDNATWVLSASPKDARFWADSSIPVVGVLRDPDTGDSGRAAADPGTPAG